MVSSALQERNGVLAGFSQGSGVIDPRQRSGHETTSRKSSSLPTQAMMKVPALDRLLRFGALCRGFVQSIHLSTLTAAQAGGCELFCSDSGRAKAQANNDRSANPKRSVFNLS
jgi:hypothetical protein